MEHETKTQSKVLGEALDDLLDRKKSAVKHAHANPTYNSKLLKNSEKELFNTAMLSQLHADLLKGEDPQVEIFASIVHKTKSAGDDSFVQKFTDVECAHYLTAKQYADQVVSEARDNSVNHSRRRALKAWTAAAVVGLVSSWGLDQYDKGGRGDVDSKDDTSPRDKNNNLVNLGIAGALATAAHGATDHIYSDMQRSRPAEAWELFETHSKSVDALVNTIVRSTQYYKEQVSQKTYSR